VVLASTNEATPKTSSLPFDGCCDATFKNKSNGIALFATSVVVAFDRNSTKHSWIQRVPLIGLEESLQGVEELELNVEVSLYNAKKWWVENCGVHLIMEKSKADSDIHGEKWDHEIDMHALGPSTTDDQRLESSLIRELQKWKITRCINICRDFFSDVNRIVYSMLTTYLFIYHSKYLKRPLQELKRGIKIASICSRVLKFLDSKTAEGRRVKVEVHDI
jgi:hypothetical protein